MKQQPPALDRSIRRSSHGSLSSLPMQALLAVLLGTCGGLAAVQMTLRDSPARPAEKRRAVTSAAVLPAVPYATVGVLLTRAGLTNTPTFLRTHHGHTTIIVTVIARRRWRE